jgi:hypothetical protein
MLEFLTADSSKLAPQLSGTVTKDHLYHLLVTNVYAPSYVYYITYYLLLQHVLVFINTIYRELCLTVSSLKHIK